MQRTLIGVALLLAVHESALAEENPTVPSCVQVVIDGVPTLPYDCLSQQLMPAETRTRTRSQAGLTLSGRSAARPPNEQGLFNRSATAIRMGTNFGLSATAQRPDLPPNYVPLVTTGR